MNNKLENLFNLDGKIIVITGACGLLGQKHAEAIAAFGGTPVLLDLSQQDIDKVSIKIQNEYSVNASGLAVDITNEDEVARSSSWAIEKYGKIDGLVNNAANNPKVEKNRTKQFSRLENFPLDLWNTDIAVGLTGSFLCAKYYGNLISQNPNDNSCHVSSGVIHISLIPSLTRIFILKPEIASHLYIKVCSLPFFCILYSKTGISLVFKY